MGIIATNFNEQIELLKSRGMELDYSEEKVKEFLLDIGYYRLGFYWNPFEIDNKHNFQKGTKFSDIIKLYYLDVDLRNLLSRYINRIEINFRAKIIYYVSNKFKGSPTWFFDPAIMMASFVSQPEKYYNSKFISNNKPIKMHHRKYINDKYAPAWKTLEFFTFGTILTIYQNIKDEGIKGRISNVYGVRDVKKFINLMSNTLLIRNLCAHGDIMFDFRAPKGLSVIPDITFNKGDRNSLDASIKVILYFLGKISINRQNDLGKELQVLFDKFNKNENLKKIIKEKINYLDI
ncbi:DNA-binding protein [Tenacibaculum sp. SZ-18]|uniref:Abi family protein n=1 Tax=Tenacibaculum sp. SZ-18 TaxID=754423 RepID=UPI000C2CEA3B|nr:Abi family protein [Tenacibaculum sp. SZ-18]AUC16600.1 DNA-binding protein [Tenacibaculum sp. SZ-18]